MPARTRSLAIAAILVLGVARPSAAATGSSPPAGYSVDRSQARFGAPPPCDEKSKEYVCRIERTASDSVGNLLLPIAEAVYPPRNLLANIAAREGYEMGDDTSGVAVWWCQGKGARRIPYAVTRGALDYYLKLTRKYRDHDYHEPGAQTMFSCDLYYRATIARRDEFAIGDKAFTDVYVASIALNWSYDDGTFVPMVSARRTVVLSPRGDLLAVDGDGLAVEDVTFSDHRGLGRSTELRR
jgi:hypothetical protein